MLHQIVEGQIEAIAFGGSGILRHQGLVIFVPFTAVGDIIQCQITKCKRSFAEASLIKVMQPSEDRVIPPCPYFGTCGGCQLQHMRHEAQLRYKETSVSDNLKKIGKIFPHSLRMIPASQNWFYRRHVTLHIQEKEGRFRVGYIGQDQQSLILIHSCMIFNEPNDFILIELHEIISQLEPLASQKGRVTLLKTEDKRTIAYFQFEDCWKIPELFFESLLKSYPNFSGFLVKTSDHEFSVGEIMTWEEWEGLTFSISPRSFIQNNAEQSNKIIQDICSLVSVRSEASEMILDLYCGFGKTSLTLAKRGHRVIGMELNPHAVHLAKENAIRNRLENVDFLEGDVAQLLPHWLKKNKPRIVLVNPPRQGLDKEVLSFLLRAKPEAIVYVSCMPSTLARDLQEMAIDYSVEKVIVYDMFPQTSHVETLAYLLAK